MKKVRDKIRLAPTDLSNYLVCRHLSGPDLRAAEGVLVRPALHSVFRNALKERGVAHEKAYLEYVAAQTLELLPLVDLGGDAGAADSEEPGIPGVAGAYRHQQVCRCAAAVPPGEDL